MRRRRTGTIEVSDAAWLARGATLTIGSGEDMELVRVLAVDGTTVMIGRWRWWHTAAARVRRWLHDVREAAVIRWCALRGHRLEGEYCWCGKRENPAWLDERED